MTVISLVVPKSTATNRVDNDKEDKEDAVDYCNFLPCALDVVEKTRLARLAIEAELVWCVVPALAVWIIMWSSRLGPVCGTYVSKLALF